MLSHPPPLAAIQRREIVRALFVPERTRGASATAGVVVVTGRDLLGSVAARAGSS